MALGNLLRRIGCIKRLREDHHSKDYKGGNHVSHGLAKINPSKRMVLEMVSFILILVTWCFTIPGIVLLAKAGVVHSLIEGKIDFGQLFNLLTKLVSSGDEDAPTIEKMPEGVNGEISIFKAVGNNIFVASNIFYTIITLIFMILNLIYRRDYLKMSDRPEPKTTEWADRKDKDHCCGICIPCNGLRMFHHLEHRAAFIVNLLCAIMGVDLYFSIPMVLLTFAQTIISYLYAEDIVLCGMPLCCVQLLFIRRYPKDTEQEVVRV